MTISQAQAQTANVETAIEHMKQSVIGTWRLVSCERYAVSGTITQPLGDNPVGYVVYTEDDRVFVQLMRRGPRAFGGGDIFAGTANECWDALGYASYGGTYEFRDGRVVHRVELSVFPHWAGVELPRQMEWDGKRLILTTPPAMVNGVSQYSRLTWERVGH
jgi:Lipocalin-like domain